jgi:hypothetical protein
MAKIDDLFSTGSQAASKVSSVDKLFNEGSTHLGLPTMDNLGVDSHGNYDNGINVNNADNRQDIRANNQSNLQAWGNGITKMASTAASSAVESVVGVAAGLGAVLTGGKFLDNSFTRGIDDWNKAAEEQLPVFTSKASEDLGAFEQMIPGSGGARKFWADKFLGGAGYMAGAIATGYGLGKFASIAKMVSAGKALGLEGKAGAVLEKLAEKGKYAKYIDAADMAKNSTVMAHSEARQEGQGAYDDTKAKLLADLHKNIVEQEGADRELHPYEAGIVEDHADAARNLAYGVNLALVGGADAILFGKMLTKGYKQAAAQVSKDATASGIELVAGLEGKASQAVAKKMISPTLDRLLRMGEGVAVEGGQEGLQYTTQKMAADYYGRRFDKTAGTPDMIESAIKGLSETLGSKEGLESILLGALLGGPAGVITTRGERKQNEDIVSRGLDILNNSSSMLKLSNKMQNSTAASSYQVDRTKAAEAGDKFEYKNAQHEMNKGYIKQNIDAGTTDLLIDKLESSKGLNEEEFKKAYSEDQDAKLHKPVSQIIDEKIKEIKHLVKLHEDVQAAFPNRGTTVEARMNHENLTNLLWGHAANIDNVDVREKELGDELSSATRGEFTLADLDWLRNKNNWKHNYDGLSHGLETPELEVDLKKIKEKYKADYKKQFEVKANAYLANNPHKAGEVIPMLNDLGGLITRREGLIKAYNVLTDTKGQKLIVENLAKQAKAKVEAKAKADKLAKDEEATKAAKVSQQESKAKTETVSTSVDPTNTPVDIASTPVEPTSATEATHEEHAKVSKILEVEEQAINDIVQRTTNPTTEVVADIDEVMGNLRTVSTGLKIQNLTQGYDETVENGKSKLTTNTEELNKDYNTTILLPTSYLPGTKLHLEIDTEFNGPVTTDDSKIKIVGTKTFIDYITADGLDLDVPIKILDESGKLLGYLPRQGWISAKIEGTDDYRNTVDEYDTGDDLVTDNVARQLALNKETREAVINTYLADKASKGRTLTIVTRKSNGMLNLLLQEEAATKALPDTTLQFAIVKDSTAQTAKGVRFSVSNENSLSGKSGQVLAVLPTANGEHFAASVKVSKLTDSQVDVIERLITLHLVGKATAEVQSIEEKTGLNILEPKDLDACIKQYYTYTENIDFENDFDANKASERNLRLKFSITSKGIFTVRMGSGVRAQQIKLKEDGTLENSGDLIRGLSSVPGLSNGRLFNTTFTERDVQGINSTKKIAIPIFSANRTIEFEPNTIHYNEYLKRHLTTNINGKTVVDGKHVYATQPVIEFAKPGYVEPTSKTEETTETETTKAIPQEIGIKPSIEMEDEDELSDPSTSEHYSEQLGDFLVKRANDTYYNSTKQSVVVNVLIAQIGEKLRNGMKYPEAVVTLRKELKGSLTNYTNVSNGIPVEGINVSVEKASLRAKEFKDIVDNFDQFENFMKERLLAYGLVVRKDRTIDVNDFAKAVEDDTDGLEYDEIDGKILERYDQMVAELDPRDTASSRLKMFLASIEEVTRKPDGRIVGKPNFLGLPSLVAFDSLFEDIMSTLADKEVSYESFKSVLLSESTDKPVLEMLVRKLDASGQQMQNEFVSVMAKHYQDFITVSHENKFGTWSYKVFSSNQNSIDKIIKKQWAENQKNGSAVETVGNETVISKKFIDKMSTSIKAIQDSKKPDTEQLDNFAKELLEGLGIILPEAAFEQLKNNTDVAVRGTKLPTTYEGQFSKYGMFNLMVEALKSIDASEGQSRLEMNNPLVVSKTPIKVLSRLAAKYSPKIYSTSLKNVEGKSVYNYGLTSHESRVWNKLKNDPEFISKLSKTAFAQSSQWLKDFNDPLHKDRMELGYLDGLTRSRSNTKGVKRSDMSPREMQKSDKTTTPIITARKHDIKNVYRIDGKIKFSKATIDAVLETVNSEILRVSQYHAAKNNATKFNYNLDKYDQGGKFFFINPWMNANEMQQYVSKGVITEEEFNTIYPTASTTETIKEALIPIITDKGYLTIKKLIAYTLAEKVEDTLKAWEELSITSGSTINTFHKEYVEGIKSEYREGSADINLHAATDFVANYEIAYTNMMQLISGDPALNFKKNVETTMKEYQKRLAKDIAPGSLAQFTDKYYKSITLKDHKAYAEYMSKVPGYSKESASDGTDAQELTTVRERLAVMQSYGEIGQEQYERMISTIKDGKYYEFTKEDLAIFQPDKPVQVSDGFRDGIRLIHYVKTSSFPLLPQLTVGTELDKLRVAMESNEVNRAVYHSGKKQGGPFAPVDIWEGDRIMEDALESNSEVPTNWDKAVQQLDRAGFSIQQKVPYDPSKHTILTVSQMNKLLFEGILDIEGFDLKGKNYTGKELKDLKESIRIRLFETSKDEFLKQVGATIVNDKIVLKDVTKLIDVLKKEAKDRNYPINDLHSLKLDENGQLLIPLLLNNSANKFETLLLSAIKNRIINQNLEGKSFVQGSGAGFLTAESLTSAQKSSIVMVEGYSLDNGLEFLHKIDGVVKPAQVLIPFKFRDNNGNLLSAKDFMKNGKIDTAKLPTDLLRLIGARIPNQGHNSMLPIQVVGFLPKEMGDLIVVPELITKQMGSDFDVDKLYTYMFGYKYDQGVFTKLDYNTEDINQLSTAELKDLYTEIHWSVLTHPELTDKITSPLDKDDLKEEAKAVTALVGNANKLGFNYIQNQLNDFISQKSAKTLVGSSALGITFNTILQDKNLFLRDEAVITVQDSRGKVIELHKLSGTAKSYYRGLVRSKHDNLVIQNNAYLDNAKERIIDRLNMNDSTWPASQAISQLEGVVDGEAVALDVSFNAMLLTQEIIFDYAREMSAMHDTTVQDFDTNAKQTIIDKLTAKYLSLYQQAGGTESELSLKPHGELGIKSELDKVFSAKDLEDLLRENKYSKEAGTKNSIEYYRNQLAMLNLFLKFDTVGSAIRTVQSAINADTKGAGKNMLESAEKETKMNKLAKNPTIANADTLLTGTELGSAATNSVVLANRLYTDLFPYNRLGIQTIFERIAINSLRVDSLSAENKKLVIEGIKSYIFSSILPGVSPEQRRKELFLDKDTNIAKLVQDAKNTSWGKTNFLVQRLITNIATIEGELSNVEYAASSAARLDEMDAVKAWIDLLMGNEQERALGNALIEANILNGGIQGANNIVKFLPTSYYFSNDIDSTMRSMLETVAKDPTKALAIERQYFQHNPSKAAKLSRELTEVVKATKESITLPAIDMKKLGDNKASHLMVTNVDLKDKTDADSTYPSYLSWRDPQDAKWYLYERTDIPSYNKPINYTRIDTLGTKNFIEYNGTTERTHSILKANKAKKVLMNDPSAISIGPGEVITNDLVGTEAAHKLGLDFRGTGSKEDLANALSNIANNTEVSSDLQILAKIMEAGASLLNDNFKIVSSRSLDKRGSYNTGTNLLSINPVASTKNSYIGSTRNSVSNLASTLLHEAGHALTSTEYKRWNQDKANYTHKERAKIFNRLDELKELTISKLGIKNEVDSTRTKHREGTALTEQEKSLYYGLINTEEFITMSMTDPAFMEQLNSVSYGSTTLLQRFINLVSQFITELASNYGIEVKDNGVLKETLHNIFNLVAMSPSEDNFISEDLSEPMTNDIQSREISMGLRHKDGTIKRLAFANTLDNLTVYKKMMDKARAINKTLEGTGLKAMVHTRPSEVATKNNESYFTIELEETNLTELDRLVNKYRKMLGEDC